MSVIDWATKPAPWCWIGPQLRAECEAIIADKRLPIARRTNEGGKLRDRRIALGLTQSALASAAKISLQSIKNVENDRGTVRLMGCVKNAIERAEEDRHLAKTQAFAR